MSNVGVTGVGNVIVVVGIGDITFTLTSEHGDEDDIILNNIIHLPDCTKDLLSITWWSKDR